MATIGIDKLHYAKVIKDDKTGVTYSTVTRVPGLIEINIDPQTNSTTIYADDMPYATATAQGEINVSINVEDLPLEIHADLLGHEIKDGVMISSGEDEPPDVAIMFQSKQRDGSTKYVKLLKGKFREPSENPKTKTDTPEFVTPTLEGTFINRIYDKIWKKTAVSSNRAFTGAETWYDSVE